MPATCTWYRHLLYEGNLRVHTRILYNVLHDAYDVVSRVTGWVASIEVIVEDEVEVDQHPKTPPS